MYGPVPFFGITENQINKSRKSQRLYTWRSNDLVLLFQVVRKNYKTVIIAQKRHMTQSGKNVVIYCNILHTIDRYIHPCGKLCSCFPVSYGSPLVPEQMKSTHNRGKSLEGFVSPRVIFLFVATLSSFYLLKTFFSPLEYYFHNSYS